MKTARLFSTFCAYLIALGITPSAWATDWPGFRGPAGNGVVPESERPPLKWSEKGSKASLAVSDRSVF